MITTVYRAVLERKQLNVALQYMQQGPRAPLKYCLPNNLVDKGGQHHFCQPQQRHHPYLRGKLGELVIERVLTGGQRNPAKYLRKYTI